MKAWPCGYAGMPISASGCPISAIARSSDEPVRIVARLLGVATDDERAIDAGAFEPGDQVGQVGAVPDHPRREMRHGSKAASLEPLAQGDGRLDPLCRRRRDRHGRAWRQELGLVERVLERDELEGRGPQDASRAPSHRQA